MAKSEFYGGALWIKMREMNTNGSERNNIKLSQYVKIADATIAPLIVCLVILAHMLQRLFVGDIDKTKSRGY